MRIFNNDAFVSAAAAKNYTTQMELTHPDHMLPPNSPYFGSGNKIVSLEKMTGATHITGAGTFQHAMLQALDKVSNAQHFASDMAVEAFINPDAVDIHDVTMAQAQANMSLGITRNILSRLVQGWRDLINTR